MSDTNFITWKRLSAGTDFASSAKPANQNAEPDENPYVLPTERLVFEAFEKARSRGIPYIKVLCNQSTGEIRTSACRIKGRIGISVTLRQLMDITDGERTCGLFRPVAFLDTRRSFESQWTFKPGQGSAEVLERNTLIPEWATDTSIPRPKAKVLRFAAP